MQSDNLYQDGTRRVTLSDQQFNEIERCLKHLAAKSSARAILLTDSSGLMVAQTGSMNSSNLVLLATVASANYAATIEMAKLVGEREPFKVHFHEGVTSNIYVAGVTDDYSLVVIFGKETTLGLVRVNSTKVIEELAKILSRDNSAESFEKAKQSFSEHVKEHSFQEQLSGQLDAIFQSSKS